MNPQIDRKGMKRVRKQRRQRANLPKFVRVLQNNFLKRLYKEVSRGESV